MDTIIQIKDLGKTFTGKDNTVEALKRRAVPGIRGTFDRTVATTQKIIHC